MANDVPAIAKPSIIPIRVLQQISVSEFLGLRKILCTEYWQTYETWKWRRSTKQPSDGLKRSLLTTIFYHKITENMDVKTWM